MNFFVQQSPGEDDMAISRRSTLLLGASALAGLGMTPRIGRTQAADSYAVEGGELTVHPRSSTPRWC